MKALRNTFLLLLATFVLTSCGGGGGGSNSVFTPSGADSISVNASPSSIGTNSFTAITVTVNKSDGTAEDNGTSVSASLSPTTIGTVTATAGTSGGSSATAALSGGKATFYFNSTNQAGTATIVFSLPAGLHGNPNSASKSVNVTVTAGNTQDPRLQLTATSTTLPLDPYNSEVFPFTGNFIGSPYVSEVTVTFRRSNGELVNGTVKVNVSIDPVTIAGFSTLDDPTTAQSDPTKPDGNEFLTIFGSGFVNVTGGHGVIFVHSFDIPGTTVLTVTAIDPDSGQTISSQLTFTVAGAASNLPSSITAVAEGGLYVAGTSGPQSTIVRASVYDGNNATIPDPSGFDNVQFQIAGPAGNDARLTGVNAAGTSVTGSSVSTVTHNGIATVTLQSGVVEGPVQVKVIADRADNNVDNGIQDPISATATVTISNGKLYSITINAPDADAVNTSGVSADVVEDPAGSGNYQLVVSATGVDNRGNAVVQSTQIGFGDVDSPQVPNNSENLLSWFQISGNDGDPQEGGTLFTSASGRFTTAGGGAAPGDTLLVIGKQTEGAPANNDDLESAVKVVAVNSATSLTVATPFNLNDHGASGNSVDNHGVLPYLVGRSTFTSIQSPSYTDQTSANPLTGVATTTLNYPSSAVGKAVAIWAQGTGVDTTSSPGRTDIVTDVKIVRLPGISAGAIMTASPDPLLGNTTETVTVCYLDGTGRPIANYDINFAFALGGTGTGKVDGVPESGTLQNLTGSNGCATAQVQTSGLATGTNASITFSAGPANAGGASVTVGFVVNVGALQVSPCQFKGSASPQTVVIKIVDGGGAPLANQSVSGACTVLSGAGTIVASAPLATDQSGVTYSIITVTPASDTAPIGYCTFTSGTLVQSVGVNTGSCSTGSGGFSPTP